jgi:hypothetical protein
VEGSQRVGHFISKDNDPHEGPGDIRVASDKDVPDDFELDSLDSSESESRLEKIATVLLNCNYDISYLPEEDRRYLLRLLRRRSLELCPVRAPWWAAAPSSQPLVTSSHTGLDDRTEPVSEGSSNNNDGITKFRVTISQNIRVFSHNMRATVAAIRSTPSAQRLLQQDPQPAAHEAWAYQVLGMLLGYVVSTFLYE